MRSTGLKDVGLSRDNENVRLRFNMEDGSVNEIELSLQAFSTTLLDLKGIATKAIENEFPKELGVVPAVAPKRVAVSQTDEGDHVLLLLETENGLKYNYVFPTAYAAQLGKRISDEATRRKKSNRPN